MTCTPAGGADTQVNHLLRRYSGGAEMIAKIIFHINVLELIGLGITVLFFLFFIVREIFKKGE